MTIIGQPERATQNRVLAFSARNSATCSNLPGSAKGLAYRRYGPFSEELASGARDANALGLFSEKERPATWGGFIPFSRHDRLATPRTSTLRVWRWCAKPLSPVRSSWNSRRPPPFWPRRARATPGVIPPGSSRTKPKAAGWKTQSALPAAATDRYVKADTADCLMALSFSPVPAHTGRHVQTDSKKHNADFDEADRFRAFIWPPQARGQKSRDYPSLDQLSNPSRPGMTCVARPTCDRDQPALGAVDQPRAHCQRFMPD